MDIPDDIKDSWYRGQVRVGFKDAAFEASSPIRHATELSHVLSSSDERCKPVLFIHSHVDLIIDLPMFLCKYL